MYMKITSILLVVLLASMAHPARAFAGDKPGKKNQFAQKVKSEIAKLGTGPDARVEVKLQDKRKLKGYISEVGDQSFAVVDHKTGTSMTIMYPQVKQVKGNNLSTGAAIAIGIAIGIGIIVLFAIIGAKVAQ